MIIICPSCRTQAEIPTSKEGAKVRCPECERVYVARRVGERRSSSNATLPIVLGTAGVIVVAGILVMVNRSGREEKPKEVRAAAEPVKKEELVDQAGYDSEIVRATRELYKAIYLKDRSRILALLHPERTWQGVQSPPEAQREGEETPEPEDGRAWSELTSGEQASFMDEVVDGLLEGDPDDVVTTWDPFDGEVTLEDGDEAVARLTVQSRDPQITESRNAEFHLARQGSGWRIWHWRRWYSPAELKNMRIRRSKITQTRTLSDGSVVIEAEPKPLEHYPDTPPELRKRIDSLFATMIDVDSDDTKASPKAMWELVEIGKPALPVLLTGLYEIPLETEQQAIQVNFINQALEEITGYYTGYKPMVAQGSGVGTSEERRQSAIKQWFGWWYRKGQKFEEDQSADLLDDALTPVDERERRQQEKYKREHEKARGDKP